MFEEINIDVIYIILLCVVVIVLYFLFNGFRPKTLIDLGMPGGPRKRIGHINYEVENQAGEVHLYGMEPNKPIARTATRAENGGIDVRLLHGDVNGDDNLTDYRMRGFVTSDGLIYRQFNKKETPVCVGYTARQSRPNEPTVKGERRWNTLWLKSKLAAYLGEPNATENAQSKQVAECTLDGIIFKRHGRVTTEAKACAFSVLYGLYAKKEKEDEYYKEPSYGWADTALVSSFIFCVIYAISLLVARYALGMESLCPNQSAVGLVTSIYFAIWWCVRRYKIYTVDEGHSIQQTLDLINKSIGIGLYDKIMLLLSLPLCCLAVMVKCYDVIPFLISMSIGFGKNSSLWETKTPWKIVTSYQAETEDNDDEMADFADTTPPVGEVPRRYTWYLDSFSSRHLQGAINVNFSTDYMSVLREENPCTKHQGDMSNYRLIDEILKTSLSDFTHREHTLYIAKYIESLSRQMMVDDLDQLQFTLDFVQEPNLKYCYSGESKSVQYASDYVRMPDETLFDQEGDLACKSLLASVLLHHQGYETLFVASTMKKHAGVAVRIKRDSWINMIFGSANYLKNTAIMYNNHSYIYCETSGDGYKIGKLPDGIYIDDFDVKVELPSAEEDSGTQGFTI